METPAFGEGRGGRIVLDCARVYVVLCTGNAGHR
jgi:hypothetical protein